jgi:hypothetical protein
MHADKHLVDAVAVFVGKCLVQDPQTHPDFELSTTGWGSSLAPQQHHLQRPSSHQSVQASSHEQQ